MPAQGQGSFIANIQIIGVNPYVIPPEEVLKQLFDEAGKDKGKIPVIMTIDGHEFPQTLIKYSGGWKLYLNMPMRRAAGKDVGDEALISLRFNPYEQEIDIHPSLYKALQENAAAQKAFEQLAPSLQKEIMRYFARLKTAASVDRNVIRAINFLLGEERFVGRAPVRS